MVAFVIYSRLERCKKYNDRARVAAVAVKYSRPRFNRAALNAGRSTQKKAVRLSVRQTRALWQNGRKIYPDFYTMRKII